MAEVDAIAVAKPVQHEMQIRRGVSRQKGLAGAVMLFRQRASAPSWIEEAFDAERGPR